MVKEAVTSDNEIVYVCEECGFAYKEREWAEKCQKWCRQHQSCNLEITEHAVGLEQDGTVSPIASQPSNQTQ